MSALSQNSDKIIGFPSGVSNRWFQLIAGIACVVMIANLQYGWTYFVDPINVRHQWGREAIQWSFTIFVMAATWLVPIKGWFSDRFGPRLVVTIGGAFVAAAWVINSQAQTLPVLYLGMALSGIGNGAVWTACMGNALKWFPDRRGLAAGLTAMGYGGGSVLTIVPIMKVIEAYGYETAFFWFGLGQGFVILFFGAFLVAPRSASRSEGAGPEGMLSRGAKPVEMLITPIFWAMYLMFGTVAASGLIVSAQIGPIIKTGGAPVIAVIIELTLADGRADDYFSTAQRLRAEVETIDGFISVERFESITQPGKFVALSFWRDDEALRLLRINRPHQVAQRAARGEFSQITACAWLA